MRQLFTLRTTAGISYQDDRGLFFWRSSCGPPDWACLPGVWRIANIALALDCLEFA